MDVSFQNVSHALIFVNHIRYINTKLVKSCSQIQKLLKVAKIEKKLLKTPKLLKCCQAQYVHISRFL